MQEVSGNIYFYSHAVSFCQNLLSSRLQSRNVNIKIYKTVILPLVLHGCETWSLILTEEHRLRVFENRDLRGISGPKRNEVKGERRICITRSFIFCIHPKISLSR
jgi:hypothetical protein